MHFHPHFHVLLTCGAFTPQGEFLELPELDLDRLQIGWQLTATARRHFSPTAFYSVLLEDLAAAEAAADNAPAPERESALSQPFLIPTKSCQSKQSERGCKGLPHGGSFLPA